MRVFFIEFADESVEAGLLLPACRFGGKAAIAEFTKLRWITIEDPKQHYRF